MDLAERDIGGFERGQHRDVLLNDAKSLRRGPARYEPQAHSHVHALLSKFWQYDHKTYYRKLIEAHLDDFYL
jgi:hypothetical protein